MLTMAECDRDGRKERQKAYLREWRAKNRDIYRSHSKAHYEADRDKILARQYGLTPETVRALRRASGGRCAICGVTPDGKGLQIDHDHATGVVRDLLCGKCNTGIAMFKENTQSLVAAVAYLEKHRSRPRTDECWRVLVESHPDPLPPSPLPKPVEWWERERTNIRKTAEMCGVSVRTVNNWIRNNQVEYALTPGGQVRIFVDSLLKSPPEE